MKISFEFNPVRTIYCAVFLAVLIACFTLITGSYAENEPYAARMFIITTVVVAVLGGAGYYFLRRGKPE